MTYRYAKKIYEVEQAENALESSLIACGLVEGLAEVEED